MSYTVEQLAEEQAGLNIARFDYAFVWQLGGALRERALAINAPIAITITHGADLVFSLLMPGATTDNLSWAARKRATTWRFHRSSLSLRLEAEAGGFDFNRRYHLPEAEFAATGGAVPLILKGSTIIGMAAVSGLPNVEDHKLIVDCLRSLNG